ncbi:hypothetical protein HB662_27750 [Roseomonas frigidaquae]|uniref:Uncharacterized protein n=1 Tax=Falsiroseomonas frigidaquae TaxID=487318 RepID=A0ABX1F891_9PROT|nr:hypothetical protein [Falsiroseomonas frigidaquae]NKE48594.1 hypothetical protein [Falsiroseomonas frigidaquae]
MRLDPNRLRPNWTTLRRWSWPVIVTGVAIAFALLVVRPFDAAPDPAVEDVAQAWNRSVGRLGVLPVFPPEEDLHVGDLWAFIASDASDTPLLGKAVRLAQLDLRDLLRAPRRRPVFPDTVAREEGGEFRRQPRTELTDVPPPDAIALTLTAFPGIVIRHSRRVGSTAAGILGAFGARREILEEEEIRIPVAETYGVHAAAAAGRFDEWCAAPETALLCTDAFARRTLAYAVSDRVLETREGRYVVPVHLRLVTRVFLMREIEHRRARDDGRGASARGGPAAPGTAPTTDAGEAHLRASLDRAAGAEGAVWRADSAGISLRQVFQRPVVFGMRAVTFALPPSQPPAPPTETRR